MTPTQIADAKTRRSRRLFLAQVSARYPVRDTYLFGSRARGDFRADSDADLAILLRGHPGVFLDTKLDAGDLDAVTRAAEFVDAVQQAFPGVPPAP
ncbi:hypothetical protein CCR95_23020 [Thiocystis minor]|nr:hypothetical protein [Thiocystis minor]